MTSDLWGLVVHGDDGDVEEEVGDGAAVVVADGEDELDEERLQADVFNGRHEGDFHVVDGMLGKKSEDDDDEKRLVPTFSSSEQVFTVTAHKYLHFFFYSSP